MIKKYNISIILGEKKEFHTKISESSDPPSVYHCTFTSLSVYPI